MLVKALVDCRATRDFIDSEYVISCNLPVWRLSQPILVLNMDSTANQASGISSIVNILVDYKGHSKHIQLAMTWLGKQYVILSYSWLHDCLSGRESKDPLSKALEKPMAQDRTLVPAGAEFRM
jgi:hypothetical protein